MRCLSLVLVSSILFACFSSSTSAKVYSPKVVPEGWVDDFDYKGNVNEYLKAEVERAQESNLSLYVYVFSDRSVHCRKVRKLLSNNLVKEAFEHSRVVMLDYYQLIKVSDAKAAQLARNYHWQPMIIRVDSHGSLTQDVLYPGKHLFHYDRGVSASGRKLSFSVKESSYKRIWPFIKALRSYFGLTPKTENDAPR